MRDFAHLLRLAAAFVLVIGGYLLVRPFLVPATWGELGRFWAAAGALVAPALAAPAAPPVGAKGSCVACHRSAGDAAELRHTYGDWAKSVHAVRGVGCDGCHGGNPAKADKAAAHAGILPSGNERSPVYFTRVPETCGTCHAAELAAFRRSRHFQELQTSGRGPNCVTCHGAMANHILDPGMMETTCTLCHRRPTQAFGALLALNNASAQARRLKRGVQKARREGLDVKAQEGARDAVGRLVKSALVDWHTFRMPEVMATSQEISRRAVTAINELKVKGLAEGDLR